MPRDEIQIVSKTQFKRFYSLEIQGPVKNPKVITYSQNTKIGDLINLAGGLEVTAYQGRALVVVTDLKNGYKTIKTFNLQNILKNPQSAENSVLEPNSVVRIFDLSELRNNFQVSLYGEVRKPGDFDYADNMTLQNLVDLGGGLQFYAAGTSVEVVRNFNLSNGKYEFLKPKIYFTKISQELQLDSQIRSLVLQPFDRVFIRRNPDFVPFKMVYLEGAVRYPGYYALQADNEKLKSIYQRAGGFKPDADLKGIRVKRVQKTGDTMELVLNSRRAVNYKHSKYNIILHHGDRISVPYAENIVTITGDVNKLTDRDIGVYYTKHKRARFYIYTFAGGFTETSDRKHVVVIRADGSRVSTHQFLFIRTFPKVKPGSKIVVNTKPGYDKGNRPKKDPFNFDTFTQKLLTRTTAVLSLIGLYKVATK
jgi:protein involved in polysaccharide export with SLBB domain